MGKGLEGRKAVWVTLFLAVGVFLIFGLETWGLGELSENPLQNTPLQLDQRGIRFEGFRPTLDHIEQGRYVNRFQNGVTAVYTVDAALQTTMEKFFKKYRVPYGVFVAMDPNSGKILALVEYSAENPKVQGLALRSTYPAASIFKLITASAAIEEKKADPATSISYYRSGMHRLGPKNWTDNPKRDKLKVTLAEALARSNNAAFAKVALRWLDAPKLLDYAGRYQFNHSIPFELPVQISQMEVEESESSVARTGAGFGNVGLSPLHAALIGSAIANDGEMMTPCMVDQVLGPTGEKIYECIPRPFATAISAETAESLREMMAMTVISGTSRKAFRLKRRERSLRGITIGGKTGSLTGEDPPGKYSWFVGMAPLEAPEIAVAALVINRPLWKIKASEVAKEGFAAYFRPELPRKVATK
ncbi:MAG TPA: penicillin-binding transpeptidase domain-containing protein [Candidatus Manganitrophaceae bacterium]|nr:penicillin-binding transpeptidase domain-containing protein [Candidatus Manganitrophaceae bacterium]